jgi:hypothetical protein
MKEYQKILRIQKLSNLVGCLKKFQARRIEILLLVAIIVVIILCLMNLLTIPWKILTNSLFGLRVVILTFLLISLICLTYNQILRKRKKLTFGYYYWIGFIGTSINIPLTVINFLFILISCIISSVKVKNYKAKKYDYKSILVIDIFSLIVVIAQFFLWFYEFLLVYAKTDENLKDFIEAKIRFYQSQNQKVVNVELSDENNNYGINNVNDIHKRNIDGYINKGKSVDEDILSSNKVQIDKEKPYNNNKIGKKKDDDTSSVETK